MSYPELKAYRTTRQRTLDLVARLSQCEADEAPTGSRWSAAEILDHLCRSDKLFRREIQALVELRKAGKRPFLRRGFADFDIGIPFLPRALSPLVEVPLTFMSVLTPASLREAAVRQRFVPTRTPRVLEPAAGRPLGELRRELESMLETVEKLFAAHPDIRFRQLHYYNPLLGYTHLPGLLRFSTSHETRHQEQVRDILRKIGAWPLGEASRLSD